MHRWVQQQSCFVAVIRNEPVGFVVLQYTFFGNGFIPLICVAAAHQRQGIGQFLLAQAERLCTTPKLFTSTNASNSRAQRLFGRAGFAASGTIENLDEADSELIYFKGVLTASETASPSVKVTSRKRAAPYVERRAAESFSVVIPTSDPNCVLRPWREGDQEDLVRHANNRKVWRNLTHMFPHPYTLADANHWLFIANEDPRSVHLAIELHGQAIGGVGAVAGTGISVATADFGYWLGESFWGRGLATAAASAFKERLVQSKRFARLQAPVFAWNPPSMRVLEKVGFVREGVLRNSVAKDGELIDSVMYAYTAA